MAKISFFIKPKKDVQSIYCRLTISRSSRFEKKTGFVINRQDWSLKTGLPKQNDAEVKELRNRLDKLREDLYEKVNEANSKGRIINSEWLGHQIDVCLGRVSETGKDDTVVPVIERYINNGSKGINRKGQKPLKPNTLKKYEYLKTKFFEYQTVSKNGILRVKDIDKFFADDFRNWLVDDKQLNYGTANKIIRNLVTVCRDAKTYEIETAISLDNIYTPRHEKEHKVHLTPDELLKIEKANIIVPHLQNARKLLLLGCEIGQRISDFPQIIPENVIEYEGMRFLRIVTKKTGKEAIIPIVGKIEEILNDGFPKPISSQKFNQYIKKVCEMAEIDTMVEGGKRDPKTKRLVYGSYPKHELITSHCMRYSFVTNSKSIISNQLIRTITTHSTDKMMETYNASKDEHLQTAKELGMILQRNFDERPTRMIVE